MDDQEQTDAARYWRTNMKLVGLLLVVWFLVSYGAGILFVEPLNEIHLGGFPLGFWFAQQGSILVFIALILIYCLKMDRIDEAYGSESEEQVVAAEGAIDDLQGGAE